MYLYVIEVGNKLDKIKIGTTTKTWEDFKKNYDHIKKHIFIKSYRAENIANLSKKSLKKKGNYIDEDINTVLNVVKRYKSISSMSKSDLIDTCKIIKHKITPNMTKAELLKIIKEV